MAYDPQAMDQAKRIFGNEINYNNSAKEALQNAIACIIVTEWPEFSNPALYDNLRGSFIIDGRRSLNPKSLSNRLVYMAIGYSEANKS